MKFLFDLVFSKVMTTPDLHSFWFKFKLADLVNERDVKISLVSHCTFFFQFQSTSSQILLHLMFDKGKNVNQDCNRSSFVGHQNFATEQ